MSKAQSTTVSLVLIAGILLVAWLATIQWAFVGVLILMTIFCVFLGFVISQQPLGILISEQNLISLSRFQTVIWTIILLSGFLVIAIARIKNGVLAGDDSAELGDPLNIIFGKELLGLLGITAASMVGSPMISATKKSKTPAANVAEQTAKEMVRLNNVPDSIAPEKSKPAMAGAPKDKTALRVETSEVVAAIDTNAVGLLYKNPKVSDASSLISSKATNSGTPRMWTSLKYRCSSSQSRLRPPTCTASGISSPLTRSTDLILHSQASPPDCLGCLGSAISGIFPAKPSITPRNHESALSMYLRFRDDRAECAGIGAKFEIDSQEKALRRREEHHELPRGRMR